MNEKLATIAAHTILLIGIGMAAVVIRLILWALHELGRLAGAKAMEWWGKRGTRRRVAKALKSVRRVGRAAEGVGRSAERSAEAMSELGNALRKRGALRKRSA
ncbi:MAG: hypothetical protein LBU47_01910 [Christensenellaceae bacterium]|jgi:uncharacterized protein HemY|nr:hypothetical protein [Christensenellaceae bacterium]